MAGNFGELGRERGVRTGMPEYDPLWWVLFGVFFFGRSVTSEFVEVWGARGPASKSEGGVCWRVCRRDGGTEREGGREGGRERGREGGRVEGREGGPGLGLAGNEGWRGEGGWEGLDFAYTVYT